MKNISGVDSEDIFGIKSAVEPISVVADNWIRDINPHEIEEPLLPKAEEDPADLEEEWADKTAEEVKPAPGLETAHWEQPVEDPIQVLRRDPLAGVPDFGQKLGALSPHRHGDPAAAGGELQGIPQEIGEDLVYPLRVGLH